MPPTYKHLRSSTADKRPTASGLADGQLAINTASGTTALFFKDNAGNIVKTGPVHVGATAPNVTPAGSSGNSIGEQWLDNSGGSHKLKTWDGGAWRTDVISNADVASGAAIALSKLATGALPSGITIASANIIDGTIVNADINASAAIDLAKLGSGALPSGITVSTANIVNGTIVNADVASGAAIELTKLASGALPSGITIASSNIVDNTIVNANVASGAAIAGTKISPDFGSQNIVTSGDVQGASINGGPLAGFRNAIINGNFDIWQRGTSFSNPSTGAYLADRWVHNFDGTGSTRTISRQTHTLGQTTFPSNPKYFLRYNQSVAGSGATLTGLDQFIESVQTFAGQTISIRIGMRGNTSLTLPGIQIIQRFGTGGSPSSDVVTNVAANVAITSSFASYTFSVTVPSISGKTLGTNDNDFLWLRISLPINTTFTFDISEVQVEPGPVATPFERRPIGTELALCQRYYQIGVYSIPTSGYTPFSQYVTTPRTIPTVAIVATYTGSGGTISDIGGRGVVAGTYATTDHRIAYSASAEL